LNDLESRRLDSLEVCETVWKAEQDPLALCVAIQSSRLPAWLSEALMSVLDGEAATPGRLARLWKKRRSDAVAAERARAVAMAAAADDDATWEDTYAAAAMELTSVSPAAMRKALDSVLAEAKERRFAFFVEPLKKKIDQ
jgi:hypothetical protein